MGPIQMHREANDLTVKKVIRQSTTIILAALVDLPSPTICAKIQQGILSSGVGDFLSFLPYMGMTAILVNGPRSV